MSKSFYLILHPSGKKYEFANHDKIVVGRSPDCDVDLSQYFNKNQLSAVSRTHFELYNETEQISINDISNNGLELNGQPLQKGKKVLVTNKSKITLPNGIELEFGFELNETGPLTPSELQNILLKYLLHEQSIETLTQFLQAKKSIMLLGVAGSGKSSLLRDLSDPRAQVPNWLFCYLNCLIINDKSSYGVAKSLFSAMLTSQTGHDYLKSYQVTIDDTTLLRAIHELESRSGKKVVFLLDQFDDIYDELSPITFAFLKDIGQRVRYIFAIRQNIVAENSQAEQLFRLVGHRIWLPPFSDEMLNGVIKNYKLSLAEKSLCLQLGGQQPHLTELVAQFMAEAKARQINSIFTLGEPFYKQLLTNEPIQSHCKQIWQSLNKEEQEALLQFTQTKKLNMRDALQQALTRDKFILTDADEDSTIRTPLLATYIQALSEPIAVPDNIKGLFFDESTGEVVLDGHKIKHSDFRPLEYELLKYLYQNHEKVCTYYDISEQVWKIHDVTYDMAADKNNIAQIVSSLRTKFNKISLGSGEHYLETVRGRGYTCHRQTSS